MLIKNKAEKIESKHRIKKFINIQMYKVKSISSVASVVMWALTFVFILYPYIEHRSIHPYVAIPILFLCIITILWLLAHLYVRKLEMYKTEKYADIIHNPYAVYAVTPFEEMMYRNIFIPLMENDFVLLPDGEQKTKIGEKLKRVKNWVELGYIPNEDFPGHLKKFLITKDQFRL